MERDWRVGTVVSLAAGVGTGQWGRLTTVSDAEEGGDSHVVEVLVVSVFPQAGVQHGQGPLLHGLVLQPGCNTPGAPVVSANACSAG